MNDDLISRKNAIDAVVDRYYKYGRNAKAEELKWVLEALPSAQPTIYGYNVEHLELIARILQRENVPPERVLEVLTDIGRIIAIISDEFQETLRKSVEQCMYCADAERRTDE